MPRLAEAAKLIIQTSETTVNRVITTGNKGCLVGAEVKCKVGDLFWLGHATYWLAG